MKKNNSISIITVVKNNDKSIRRCIESIQNQSFKNIQHIIIDGNSSDNTLSIINEYKDKISIIVTEEDDGIWDAMNKGINLATGDIIGFLNSDDFYYENALETVDKYFENNEIDFLFGSVQKYKLLHGFRPSIIKWSFGFYTSHSVGFFIKTQKHREIGYYNKKYLSADLDFFYKMIVDSKLKGISTKKSEILGKFEKGGFSSKINYIDHLFDLNRIRLDNNQSWIFVNILFILKIVKKPIKFLTSLAKKIFN